MKKHNTKFQDIIALTPASIEGRIAGTISLHIDRGIPIRYGLAQWFFDHCQTVDVAKLTSQLFLCHQSFFLALFFSETIS